MRVITLESAMPFEESRFNCFFSQWNLLLSMFALPRDAALDTVEGIPVSLYILKFQFLLEILFSCTSCMLQH